MSGKAERFLAESAADLRNEIVAIARMDSALVERDIAARRREAALGRRWANMRTRIQKELERLGFGEAEWCKRELDCDIATMRRRVQLAKGWKQYEAARRDAGNNGQYGLVYGLSLIRTEATGTATSAHRLRVCYCIEPNKLDISRCQFITGDALTELRKMPSATVNVVICSPPYWPVKRWYGGDGIGFEPTPKEYIHNLVGIFHEARRVLKNTGVLWTVIGDSFSRHGGSGASHLSGIGYQDAGRPPGNLLMIPARLAMALQDSGWILRHDVVWDKGSVRPEAVTDRVTRTHEFVYMFAKNRRYFYDQDPLRIPVVSPYSKRGQDKPGLIRRDENRRDLQVISNPLGRNVGSVWSIQRGNYRGKHPATFPPELARRMIVSSCDEKSVVLDVFGGSGTTALVALQLGHRAITIDINSDYTSEARERLAAAPANFSTDRDGQEGGSRSGRAYSAPTNVPAKNNSGNVIDLMDAKKSLRQKAPSEKIVPPSPRPARSKRPGAAQTVRRSGKRA